MTSNPVSAADICVACGMACPSCRDAIAALRRCQANARGAERERRATAVPAVWANAAIGAVPPAGLPLHGRHGRGTCPFTLDLPFFLAASILLQRQPGDL